MNRQIITAILIIFSMQTLAAGTIYYVPSRDYPTIQSAINAAVNGDEVVVAPGVYGGWGNRDIDLNGKAVTVRSQIDPDNPNWAIVEATIIDCGGSKYSPHRAFHFQHGEGLDSKVLGFTIRNGYQRGMMAASGRYMANPPVPYESIEDDPNGIPRAERGSDSTVSDSYGGAILCENASSPTIQYCIISKCSVSGGHGGDGAMGQSGPWEYQPPFYEVDANLPDPNVAPIEVLDGQWGGFGGDGYGTGYGGGIACIGGSSPLISDCIIKNNSAHGGRGGDGGDGGYAAEPPNYSQGNASHGGDAGDSYGDGIGGGIYCEYSSAATVVNCTFINNIATTGIRAEGGLVGEGNPLPEQEGGPATNGAWGIVRSDGRIAGGAAYFLESDANFVNCTFTENKAFEAFPAYNDTYDREYDPAYTVGGALYCDANDIGSIDVKIDTCEFVGNVGGAVHCWRGCDLEVKNSSFMENSDPNDGMDLWSRFLAPIYIDFGSGGAIYAGIDVGGHIAGSVIVQDSAFGFNSAKNDGGALKSESDTSLTRCSFTRNIAENGYGGGTDVYRNGTRLMIDVNSCSYIGNESVYGGGFSTENFTGGFVNCYFISNEAERGGALDLALGSVSIIGSFVKANTATDGYGGGVNCYVTEADISHSTIMDNFADGVYPTGGGGGGIYFYGLTSLHRLFNCLVVGNSATFDGGAIYCYNSEPEISSCTFDGSFAGGYGGAVFSGWGSDVQITDSIFRNNSSHAIHEQHPNGEATVTYSLFYNNPDGDYYDSGTGMTYSGSGQIGLIPGGSNNLYSDPLFVTGDLGEYYLRQLPVQSLPQSAAVDNGSDTAANIGLDAFTTRTDNLGDSGQVDMGYHYYDSADVGFFQLTASVIGGHGTVEPTSGTYYAGAIVTLTAEPDIGWRVKAWSGTDDDSSFETTNSVVMNSDRVVTVEFEQPRTLIVSLGGGQEGYYNNIQDAIQNARDGDTVVVQPGIYYGGVYSVMAYIDKSITVRSVHPDDPNCVASTIIDGYQGPPWSDWSIRGVEFGPNADAESVLNGFTIRNCGGYVGDSDPGDRQQGHPNGYDGGSTEGPAILIRPGAGPVVKNCVMTSNLIIGGNAGDGVGATLTQNAGRGGWPGWAHGGAVYCGPNSTPTFINCQIINNSANGGNGGNGGNDVEPGGEENYGGGWSVLGTPEYPAIDYDPFNLNAYSITDSYLWEVWEWDEALAYWYGFFGADPNRTSYFGNYRWYSGLGGGAYCDIGSEVSFIDCVISGNTAQGGMSGQGGFSIVGRPIDPIIPYEIPSFGGGVYCAAKSTVTFTGCTITDNVSSEPNELTHRIDLYMGHGGGVCAEDTATLIFTNCMFSGNEAAAGGALHFADANLVMSNCEILSNTGYHGGGLFGEHGDATIYRCYISGNTALEDLNEPNDTQGEGGGLHLWAMEADIIDSDITYNESEASGGGVFFGGEGEPTLTNCLITNNTAGRDGGGVSVNIFAQLTISNCTIADNELTGEGFNNSYGGGVSCSYDSYTNIIDSIVWGNSADIGSQLAVGTGFVYSPEPSVVDVSYSDVEGGEPQVFVDDGCILNWGAGNITTDPLFEIGLIGNYYLSQIAAGQSEDSDCVDSGSDTAVNKGLDSLITRTDNEYDTGQVDMGYHYSSGGDVSFYLLTASVVGGHGTVEPVSGTYRSGTTVMLTAVPDSGWRLKEWNGTDDDSSAETTNSVLMDSDKVVTVEFEQPQTLIVSVGGGEGHYTNIQEAVQDAKESDTIVVYPGIYYGGSYTAMIYMDKSITVRSLHPDDPCCVASTIIDGYLGHPLTEWTNYGVLFGPNTDSDTVLNGFTIQNCGGDLVDADPGNAQDGHPDGYDGLCGQGAGILVDIGASPVIKNCILTGNSVIGGDGGDGIAATQTENAGRGGWPGWAHGGAIYCAPNSTPTFINCQIVNNFATGGDAGEGGDGVEDAGIANYGGAWSMLGTPEYPTYNIDPFSLGITAVTDAHLWEVWEWDYASDYWPVFGEPDRTSYFGNYRWYSGLGGGAYCDIGSEVSFINCVISGNAAQGGMSGQGGQIPDDGFRDPLVAYEIPSFGGGVYCAAGSTVDFSSCTITGNISSEPNDNHRLDPYMGHGGGVYVEDTATVTFTDCTFSENEASAGGGLHFADANLLSLSNCEFSSNTAYHGGGVFGEGGAVTFYRCDINYNTAVSDLNDPNTQGQGGGLHLWGSNYNVIDCNISNNESEASGGGVFLGGEGEPTLTNCLITDNTAGRDGAGVSVNIYMQLTISNCTIVDNELTGEGFDNSYGGGVYCSYDSYTNIINSIIWGNSADIGSQLAIGTGFVYSEEPSVVDVSYSDVQGGVSQVFIGDDCVLNWVAGNIATDPLFETGPLGDYYLSQISAGQSEDSDCVNAGSDTAANLGMNSYTTSTIEMTDRSIVDMGYHYPLTADVEPCKSCDLFGDGIIDIKDFAVFSLNWLNEGCSEANDWCQGADFTFDSYVDFEDLLYLLDCWLAEDTKPPVPNPSEWAIMPYSSSTSTISMEAVSSFDVWGPTIWYYFDCYSGGGNDSGWQEDSSYTDSGLILGQEYSYRVKASDARGNETGWSTVAYVVLGEQPVPDEPDDLTAVAVSTTQINLYWSDNSSDEDGFRIESRTGAEAFAEIATVGADVNDYQDTGLQPVTTYYYRVCAYNGGGNSPYSDEVSETTPEPNEPNEPSMIIGVDDPNSTQYIDDSYWYHLVAGEITDLADDVPLWFRFECASQPVFSSDWIDSTAEFPMVLSHPINPGFPDVVITLEDTIVSYTIAVKEGGSWGWSLNWRICASYSADGSEKSCSAEILIPPD